MLPVHQRFLFKGEADLHRHLIPVHLSALDAASDLLHFEPAEMAQRVGRPCNPIIDSLGDALGGGSDDLNDLVDCIRHFGLPWIMFPPSLRLRVGLETLSQYTRMIVPKRDSNRLSRPDRQTPRRRTGSPAHSIGATAGATPAIYRYPVQVPRA